MKKTKTKKTTISLQRDKVVKTQKQLALEYGVCRNTFRAWLKPIEKKLKLTRRPLREWQIRMIYEFLDEP
jgi:ribosomal protein S14